MDLGTYPFLWPRGNPWKPMPWGQILATDTLSQHPEQLGARIRWFLGPGPKVKTPKVKFPQNPFLLNASSWRTHWIPLVNHQNNPEKREILRDLQSRPEKAMMALCHSFLHGHFKVNFYSQEPEPKPTKGCTIDPKCLSTHPQPTPTHHPNSPLPTKSPSSKGGSCW